MTQSNFDSQASRLQAILGRDVRFAPPAVPNMDPLDLELDSSYDPRPNYDDWDQDEYYSDPNELVPRGYQPSTDSMQNQNEAQKQNQARIERAFDNSKFIVGEPLGKDECFCSWKLIASYPSCFIGNANRPRAKPFFSEILEGRTWDFFYLHDPREPAKEPSLLVPTEQFELFLEDINGALDTSLTIPLGENESKFFMKFKSELPQPRYLKRSRNSEDLQIKTWPRINKLDISRFNRAKAAPRAEWIANMRLVLNGINPRKVSNSAKAQRKRVARERMLSETHAHLGLMGDFRVSGAVFVSVDVEALEYPPNPVSEVGLAILDTNDIVGITPGEGGRNWWPKIRNHHLRVKEYSKLRNRDFIKGCPDNFNFGTSTFPRKAQVAEAVYAILGEYTSASRKIIIVGHDVHGDIKYMDSVGVHLLGLEGYAGEIDSQQLHQVWKKTTNGRKLAAVLTDLGIRYQHLHNAGNDAHFTLCAVLGVALISNKEIREEEDELLARQTQGLQLFPKGEWQEALSA
ncbi:hypothetical protein G7046_g8017 [Stylonectria norvegica]|nr:hypothetical protein G7046_g8017 [Stylonectria norvegica]